MIKFEYSFKKIEEEVIFLGVYVAGKSAANLTAYNAIAPSKADSALLQKIIRQGAFELVSRMNPKIFSFETGEEGLNVFIEEKGCRCPEVIGANIGTYLANLALGRWLVLSGSPSGHNCLQRAEDCIDSICSQLYHTGKLPRRPLFPLAY